MLRRLEKILTRPIKGANSFWTLFAVSALFIAPILFAGVDYIDDTSRKLEGAYQWGSLGRMVTEGVMHLLTFNFGTMTDPGHLMQLLCIPLLALTAYVIAKAVSDGGKLSVLDVFIGAQVIPNQLLLTNLSFRFDSLSMILGDLAAVFAAYVLLQKTKYRYLSVLMATLLLVVAAGLYQSTVLMFGVVVVVVLIARYARSTERISPSFLKAVAVFVGALIVYGGMLKLFQSTGLTGQRKEIVPFNSDGLTMVFSNIETGLKVLLTFVSNIEAFLLAALVGMALGVSLSLLVYSRMKQRDLLDTILVMSTPILIALLIMGPFVLMQASNLTTQVRVLTSVIGVMILATVCIVALYRAGHKWALWLLVVPLLMNMYSISFAYVYGSTLKAQRAFDETVYESIVTTIQSDARLQNPSTVYIGGKPASPQTVETQFTKRPALMRMDVAGDNSRWYIWMRLKDEGISGKVEIYNAAHGSRAAVDAICLRDNVKPLLANELYTVHDAWNGTYVIWLRNPVKDTGDLCTEI